MSTQAPRALFTAALVALPGCFTGNFLAGQPCQVDAECGPNLACEDGRCAGATAGDPSGSSTTTTATTSTTSTTTTDPTTSTTLPETTLDPSTSIEPTTTAADPTTEITSTTVDPSTTGPACGVGTCEMIDVLIVLDNSPSMGSKYETLLSIIVAYGDVLFPLLKDACSVHIGTVTTNVFAKNVPPCDLLGALVRTDGGEPCPFAEGFPYATSADLNNLPAFNCLLTVGSQGDPDERPMDAVYQGFGAPLNSFCNGGFHREGSFLIVLLATDEDDGEKGDAQGHKGSTILPANIWAGAIGVAKGGVENLYVGAVLGDPDPNDTACPWDPLAGADGSGASPAPILRGAIESLPPGNHAIGSICNPEPLPTDYYSFFEEVAAEVKSLCGA